MVTSRRHDRAHRTDRVYRAVNAVGRTLLRALDVRVVIDGAQHVPVEGPVIVAANHVSYLDFIVLEKAAISRGRYLRYLARHDVWANRPVSWVMDRMGHVPVDRTAAHRAYFAALGHLRRGEAVGIFPEAGISYSLVPRALMPGAALLAARTGAPIVPAAIWGSQRLMTVGDPEPPPDLVRGRRVDILFGAPMLVGRTSDPIAVTRELGSRIHDLTAQLWSHPAHQPRPGEHATWHPRHLGGHAPPISDSPRLDVLPPHAIPAEWGPWAAAEAGEAPGSVFLTP